MTLEGGIQHPLKGQTCGEHGCPREPAAKCLQCNRLFCGVHIGPHLYQAHQIPLGEPNTLLDGVSGEVTYRPGD
jgi:hypothetical protein